MLSFSLVTSRYRPPTKGLFFTSTILKRGIVSARYPIASLDSKRLLLSRVSGSTDKPLCSLSLAQFWNQTVVKEYSNRQALVSRHEPANQHGDNTSSDSNCIRWSFGQMDQHVTKLVKGLRKLGIRKGDQVAILMMNCSAYAALQWGLAEIGAIMFTLNPAYSPAELKKALVHVGASTLILVPSLRSSNYLDTLRELLPTLSSSSPVRGDPFSIQDESIPLLKHLILVDNLSNRPRGWQSNSVLAQQGKTFQDAINDLNGKAIDYRDLLTVSDSVVEGENVSNLDVINLQLTSGTTGEPKAVALTSHNLLNNGIAIGDNLKFTSQDILCNVPPMFHCFGLVLGNLAAWTHGASVVFAAEGFDPVRALRAASEEKCTAMHGVPTHFIAELEVLEATQQHLQHPDKFPLPAGVRERESFDLSSLRTGLTSGSTVPIELMKRIVDPQKLGSREQTVVYGQTETSPVSFGCDVDAPLLKRCETVGQVYPHVHAKIISPDDPEGKPLPIGEPGELCTAGYIVMKGYWKDEARTAEVIQTHANEPGIKWMRTGDIGVMDEEGYVKIVGRSKDIIIRGGENLFPVNIENCIDQIQGVTTNAVIAVPDQKLGEAVGVFVSTGHPDHPAPKVTRATIRTHVKTSMGGQNAPQWIWFLGDQGVPRDFPKTASGKIQKIILREWAKTLVSKEMGRVEAN